MAEEIAWRQEQRVRLRWAHRDWQSLRIAEANDPATTNSSVLQATDVAELYRALRAGREAHGDEPGAADFYYGEMEMRRKSASASWAERRILDAYWLSSGYALRASRALAALVLVLVLSTSFLAAAGFENPQPRQATLTGEIVDKSVELRLNEADEDPERPAGVASASGEHGGMTPRGPASSR